MNRPNPTTGMRHVALIASNMKMAESFYVELMGMEVEWRPDNDNVYLTSGNDNLALHKGEEDFLPNGDQVLDHIGFILKSPGDVDDWYNFLKSHDIEVRTQPKTHRDGARSFYCYDPFGTTVQIIYHPPIAEC